MASPDLSTIAQLLYPDQHSLDFARIVAELVEVLTRLRGADVKIIWDCDDLVTFDVPETRILLAWSETEKHGLGGCLTVSVGPNPSAEPSSGNSEHDVMCSRLVERIQSRFAARGVLWRQVAGAVGADYVDDLIDTLPDLGSTGLPDPGITGLPPIDSILDDLSQADLHMAGLQSRPPHPRSGRAAELSRMAMQPGPASVDDMAKAADEIVTPVAASLLYEMAHNPVAGFGEPANDQPHLPITKSAELARLRDAIYRAEDAPDQVVYSTQMRLAAHCMNATLIVVWAPLGAAVMTYSLLKGENMRLSSRLMAVSGTLFALAHSPVGQTLSAMASGLV